MDGLFFNTRFFLFRIQWKFSLSSEWSFSTYLLQVFKIKAKKKLQRPGIEPGPPAWQARILPLNQRCLYMSEMDKLFQKWIFSLYNPQRVQMCIKQDEMIKN